MTAEVTVDTRRPNGTFGPGNHYGKGRPKKGETVLDYLRAKVDQRKAKMVDAAVAKAEEGDMKAFFGILDRLFGMPSQRMTIDVEDSPLERLMMSWRGDAEPIEGVEYTLLPPDPRAEITQEDIPSEYDYITTDTPIENTNSQSRRKRAPKSENP